MVKSQVKIRTYDLVSKLASYMEIYVNLESVNQMSTWTHNLVGFFRSTRVLIMDHMWVQRHESLDGLLFLIKFNDSKLYVVLYYPEIK